MSNVAFQSNPLNNSRKERKEGFEIQKIMILFFNTQVLIDENFSFYFQSSPNWFITKICIVRLNCCDQNINPTLILAYFASYEPKKLSKSNII